MGARLKRRGTRCLSVPLAALPLHPLRPPDPTFFPACNPPVASLPSLASFQSAPIASPARLAPQQRRSPSFARTLLPLRAPAAGPSQIHLCYTLNVCTSRAPRNAFTHSAAEQAGRQAQPGAHAQAQPGGQREERSRGEASYVGWAAGSIEPRSLLACCGCCSALTWQAVHLQSGPHAA